jgi:outer membrane immunogenic protein/high affinity Mn2+ porin
LVLGLEWDFSGLSGEELSTTDVFELFDTSDLGDGELKLRGMVDSESDMEWLTTFRGRAGAAMGPSGRFLGYITGGLAVAQVKNTFSGDIEYFDGCTLGPCEFFDPVSGDEFESFSESHTDYQFGYAVGVGGEYAFTNMVSLGLEYLYVGLPWGDERTNTVGFIGDAGGNGFLINQKAGFDDVHMVRAKLNFRFPPN